jgi:hypothetical protein
MSDDGIKAEITVTARTEAGGLFIWLAANGDYSGGNIGRRFYSTGDMPPPGLRPEEFWAPILGDISRFLAAPDVPDDIIPF